MTQITREEMIGLLQILADLPSTETKQGRGVRRRVERAIAALQAAEPAGWITEDYQSDKSATTYDREIAERWRSKGWPVEPIFKLPCPPTKAQVPQFLSSKNGEHWPSVGEKYLVWSNGCLQEEIFEFDQGDDGMGGGEYFWSRDDLDECPPFKPESDTWLPLSALLSASPAPGYNEGRTDIGKLVDTLEKIEAYEIKSSPTATDFGVSFDRATQIGGMKELARAALIEYRQQEEAER